MDSISQAALGAAIGEVVMGKGIGNKGATIGAVIATVPDLDMILYLFYDSYDMMSIHRGSSHSFLFSLLGGLLIAYILQRVKWTRETEFSRLWIFTLLVLLTHILLDAFTSYGTQLFLSFLDVRTGFDSTNVVDPVYTLPLIIGVSLTLWFAKDFYTVEKAGDKIRLYNLQVDMSGIVNSETVRAPTKGYFVLEQYDNSDFQLSSGSH